MYDVIENDNIKIENMIYEIRGKQVMLDSDLAKLYHVETKRINESVRRNIQKFPERYCWILTNEESNDFLVANCDQKKETRGGRYKNPRVFTEQAVAMLSTILKSDTAIKISLKIIDAFVEMRHYIVDNKDIYKSLNNLNNKIIVQENKLLIYDEKLKLLFSKFDKKEQLFLKGETFNAYSSVLDILNKATKEIIVIDSYADFTFLDLIKNIKCKIILITRNSDRLNNTLIDKYNKQFNNLKIIRNNNFHDRYFIIDRKEIYLCGSSINSIGDKTFMIIKLEDKVIIQTLLKSIIEINK